MCICIVLIQICFQVSMYSYMLLKFNNAKSTQVTTIYIYICDRAPANRDANNIYIYMRIYIYVYIYVYIFIYIYIYIYTYALP